MRRRLKSAAFPLHRHSLPQLVVDGVLVALAYFLAYRLRFGDLAGGVPERYKELLRGHAPAARRRRACVVFTRLRHLPAPVALRGRARLREGRRRRVVVATLAARRLHRAGQAGVADVGRRRRRRHGADRRARRLLPHHARPRSAASRFIFRALHERTLRGFRARKDARGVLIVGAGDGGRLVLREILRNPELGLRPVGFVDDDPLQARALRIDGVQVLGATDALPRILDEAEPDEVTIAIPSAPGTVRARVVQRVPRPRDPRPHAADGLRAAAERRAATSGRSATSRSRTCSAASRCAWSSTASAPT